MGEHRWVFALRTPRFTSAEMRSSRKLPAHMSRSTACRGLFHVSLPLTALQCSGADQWTCTGHMLALTGGGACVNEHYDPSQTCYGTQGIKEYTCYNTSSTRSYPVGRIEACVIVFTPDACCFTHVACGGFSGWHDRGVRRAAHSASGSSHSPSHTTSELPLGARETIFSARG
jgi:hypothetical protein